MVVVGGGLRVVGLRVAGTLVLSQQIDPLLQFDVLWITTRKII